jgi:hypothetical protein
MCVLVIPEDQHDLRPRLGSFSTLDTRARDRRRTTQTSHAVGFVLHIRLSKIAGVRSGESARPLLPAGAARHARLARNAASKSLATR